MLTTREGDDGKGGVFEREHGGPLRKNIYRIKTDYSGLEECHFPNLKWLLS